MLPESTDHPKIINGATKIEGQDYTTKMVFTIEGKSGLWRRVPRSATGIKVTRKDAILTHRGDDLVECVPYYELNALLKKVGYDLPDGASTKPNAGKKTNSDEKIAENDPESTETTEPDSDDTEPQEGDSDPQSGSDGEPEDSPVEQEDSESTDEDDIINDIF